MGAKIALIEEKCHYGILNLYRHNRRSIPTEESKMSLQSIHRTDSSTQSLPLANPRGTLKSCSKVILQLAIAALSILVGSLAAAAGLIPAAFAVTGVYGVITYGVMAATLTSMIANYFFIRSLTPTSELKGGEVKKEEPAALAKQSDIENKDVSLEQFYKALREKCRKDLIHSTQLIENIFSKSEKKQTLEKLSDEERAKHKSATLVLEVIKPRAPHKHGTQKEKELSRSKWESIYNDYDSIVVRSTKINEIVNKRLSDVTNFNLNDKTSGIANMRVAWMRAVQNVERCEINLERFKSSKKLYHSRLKEYSAKLEEEQQDLAKREAEMDKWDKRLVKGDKEYRKMLQSF
jgi:hypothetical protein